MNYLSNSLEETEHIVTHVAGLLETRNVICLYGEMGVGKTTFTQMLGKRLGVKTSIVSPTFVLIRNHLISGRERGGRLWHIDLYRLTELREALDLGIKEVMADRNNIVVIEWPEMIEHLLPPDSLKIKIEKTGDNERRFIIL